MKPFRLSQHSFVGRKTLLCSRLHFPRCATFEHKHRLRHVAHNGDDSQSIKYCKLQGRIIPAMTMIHNYVYSLSLFLSKTSIALLSRCGSQPRQEVIIHDINSTSHGQRNTGSAVTVIVNDELTVDDFAIQAQRCTAGTQSDPNVFLRSKTKKS